MVQPLWKFLRKIKNWTTIWSNNPTSRYISKGNGNRFSKRNLHSHVPFSIFFENHLSVLSTDEWIQKMWYRYNLTSSLSICMWNTYLGMLLGHEKEGHPVICDNMDRTWGYYAKWLTSQTEKDRYCISLICGI